MMSEALRLATVDFLLSEVARVTVECASVIMGSDGDEREREKWCDRNDC